MLSSIDGEPFYSDQEQYFAQQEPFDQGKYSMRCSLLSYTFLTINSYACVRLVNFKDFLDVVIKYLDTLGLCIG
jgi:hypothetical protein